MNYLCAFLKDEQEAIKLKQRIEQENKEENKFIIGFDFSNRKIYFLFYCNKYIDLIDAKNESIFLAICKNKCRDYLIFKNDSNIPILKEETKKERIKKLDALYPKIDFVFPYVTDSDPIWYEEFLKYKSEADDELYNKYILEKNFASGIQRFRDFGMLRFMFRAIQYNIPFINNVYMIVSGPSQVPDWVNQNQVKIIYHKDFIPEKYLPTFCSNTIEMFLWNIPGLSESFLYSNDDMYMTKKQNQDEWFKDGKLLSEAGIRKRKPEWSGDEVRNRIYQLIFDSTDTNTVFSQQHGIFPLKKSLMKECYDKYENEILASITRFREIQNLNQWMWTAYNFKTDNLIQYKRKLICRNINNKHRAFIYSLNLSDYDTVCLNDGGEEQTEEDSQTIISMFKKHFPRKSKFELY